MTLRERQSLFLKNVAILILEIYRNGDEATIGEAYRTPEQAYLNALPIGTELMVHSPNQKPYIFPYPVGGKGSSKSLHTQRLAIDLNLFINGKYQSHAEAYKKYADFWKSLHPDNRAGYDFGDANHFSMIDGVNNIK